MVAMYSHKSSLHLTSLAQSTSNLAHRTLALPYRVRPCIHMFSVTTSLSRLSLVFISSLLRPFHLSPFPPLVTPCHHFFSRIRSPIMCPCPKRRLPAPLSQERAQSVVRVTWGRYEKRESSVTRRAVFESPSLSVIRGKGSYIRAPPPLPPSNTVSLCHRYPSSVQTLLAAVPSLQPAFGPA